MVDIVYPTVRIADLPSPSTVGLNDYLVLQQPDGTKKLSVDSLISSQQITRTVSFEKGGVLESAKDLAYDPVGKGYYVWKGNYPKTIPANSTPASTGGVSSTAWAAFSVSGLSASDGLKFIGRCPTIAALRSIEPGVRGQKIDVVEYTANTGRGGGYFWYDDKDTTSADNGGTIIVTAGGKRWKRVIQDIFGLDVTHFGAVMDGVTDDMPALLRMHNWSRSISVTYGPGIKIPQGTIALGTMDLGTAEIPAFKMRGPEVDFGVIPALTIVPINPTTTTPMFTFKARRQEVANLRFNGKDTVQPFMVNTVTRGSYLRIKSVVATDAGGRIFQFKDSLDTKFDQVYSYRGKAAFIWGTWSNENPGSWDHLTAIEISNFNFSSHTGEYAVSLVRTGQAIMNNGWFDHCERPFDISQGGWVLNRVTQENAKYPAAAKYAKIIQTGCRFEQGAGIDYNLSGYTPDMDDDGKMPSWVTNAYDAGGVNIDVTGVSLDCGLSRDFDFSETILLNTTNQDTWFHAARITQQGRGRTCKLKFLGSSGYDSTGASLSRPTATNFGGGEANVFWELKYPDSANSQAGQVHWYGEGNCPIKEVRYVHTWSTVHIYVKVAAYALSTAMFIESNGDPRRKTGSPFYIVPYGETLTDAEMDAVVNNQVAVSRWAINKGDYAGAGIGMDLDNGKLLLNTSTVDVAGSKFINPNLYGAEHYIPIQTGNQSTRMQRYTKATLPSPSANVWGQVICTDGGAGSGADTQCVMVYSDGSKWIRVMDNKMV